MTGSKLSFGAAVWGSRGFARGVLRSTPKPGQESYFFCIGERSGDIDILIGEIRRYRYFYRRGRGEIRYFSHCVRLSPPAGKRRMPAWLTLTTSYKTVVRPSQLFRWKVDAMSQSLFSLVRYSYSSTAYQVQVVPFHCLQRNWNERVKSNAFLCGWHIL